MDYTLVGGPTPRRLTLQGAPLRWKSAAGQHDVYVPSVCIVGTEGAVRAWLAERHLDAAVLDTAFRAGDQTTQRFKDAVKAARPVRASTTKPKPAPTPSTRLKSPLRLVRQFNTRIAPNQPIKLRNHRNEEKTSPCKSALLRRVPAGEEDTSADTVLGAPLSGPQQAVALKKRLAALPPHKVLDVSTYDPTTGKGARIIARPNVRDRTRQGLPDLPLVSRTGAALRTVLELLDLHDRLVEVTW